MVEVMAACWGWLAAAAVVKLVAARMDEVAAA